MKTSVKRAPCAGQYFRAGQDFRAGQEIGNGYDCLLPACHAPYGGARARGAGRGLPLACLRPRALTLPSAEQEAGRFYAL